MCSCIPTSDSGGDNYEENGEKKITKLQREAEAEKSKAKKNFIVLLCPPTPHIFPKSTIRFDSISSQSVSSINQCNNSHANIEHHTQPLSFFLSSFASLPFVGFFLFLLPFLLCFAKIIPHPSSLLLPISFISFIGMGRSGAMRTYNKQTEKNGIIQDISIFNTREDENVEPTETTDMK
jgi:hypothetical protein